MKISCFAVLLFQLLRHVKISTLIGHSGSAADYFCYHILRCPFTGMGKEGTCPMENVKMGKYYTILYSAL